MTRSSACVQICSQVSTRAFLCEALAVRPLEASSDPVAQAAAKIGRNTLELGRRHGFAVGEHMHDSLAVSAFLDPSLLRFQKYCVDVETSGELTPGETLGYSPTAGDLRRLPGWQNSPEAFKMTIEGSAPTLARTTTSPVLRDKWNPNTNVAVDVESARFFQLLIGRLLGKKT